MTLELDHAWIEEAMFDCKSGASNIVAVQTADPFRVNQLLGSLATHFPDSFYHYRPWIGLERWDPAKKRFQPMTTTPSAVDPSLTNDLRHLPEALHHMENILRGATAAETAFVLRDLDALNDRQSPDPALFHAFRCWATDNRILAKGSVICLIASDPALVLDSATLSMTVLARPPASAENERLSLVQEFAKQASLRLDDNMLQGLTAAARGLTLHQASVVLRKSYAPAEKLTVADVKHHKAEYIKRSDVLEIEEPTVGFGDVGGYEEAKALVRSTLIEPLQKADKRKKAALPFPRGLLLYGPPGTGKTLFAKCLAKETNLPFINLKTEDLFSPYLGVSGQRLRDAIRMAEAAAPGIVFIDEIDRFGNRASGSSDGASQETLRVFSQMLEWLGNADRKSIIIGTTNMPHHLDEAFIRPGRFSALIPFLYPDKTAREQILRIHLGLGKANDPRRPEMDEHDVASAIPGLANDCAYYAGCDLEDLVIRAKQAFFSDPSASRMTGGHLKAAFRKGQINITERIDDESFYSSWKPSSLVAKRWRGAPCPP